MTGRDTKEAETRLQQVRRNALVKEYCTRSAAVAETWPIIQKIIKIVATRYQILRLKCTKFDFGWGSAPDPAEGDYSAPPCPLAAFKGSYF